MTAASDAYGLGVLLAALTSEPGQAPRDASAKQAYRFQPATQLQLDAGIMSPAGKVRSHSSCNDVHRTAGQQISAGHAAAAGRRHHVPRRQGAQPLVLCHCIDVHRTAS